MGVRYSCVAADLIQNAVREGRRVRLVLSAAHPHKARVVDESSSVLTRRPRLRLVGESGAGAAAPCDAAIKADPQVVGLKLSRSALCCDENASGGGEQPTVLANLPGSRESNLHPRNAQITRRPTDIQQAKDSMQCQQQRVQVESGCTGMSVCRCVWTRRWKLPCR